MLKVFKWNLMQLSEITVGKKTEWGIVAFHRARLSVLYFLFMFKL